MIHKTIGIVIMILVGSILTYQSCLSEKPKTDASPGKSAFVGNTRDSDGDGLTDEIEVELGTNPNNRDTDHDGLTDGYELSYKFAVAVGALSPGKEKEYSNVPVKVDRDKDNIHAALDPDDDNDGRNDGDKDSDGDGVSNKLEYYGYYYDAIEGQFMPWYTEGSSGIQPGDPNKPHFFTDPTQFSTDQDPYGDGTEVSGIEMDQSVIPPGDHPLVPAYPDIYVYIESYTVTPIESITSSQGGQASSSWTNTTTNEKNSEHNWGIELGVSVETKTGLFGSFSTEYSLKTTAGGRYGSSNSITKSNSGFTQEQWDTATTIDTSKAAFLELNVKYGNFGTAVAHNIIPTITLMLGNKKEGIITYTVPGEKGVNLPPQKKSATINIGDPEDPIHVTLQQLKEIQMYIPLVIEIPDMDAFVKQKDNGGYKINKEWDTYIPEVNAVSAYISIDDREGEKIDYIVYAYEKNGNGPEVTLENILTIILGDSFKNKGEYDFEINGIPANEWAIGFSENALKSEDPTKNVIKQLDDQNGANGNLLKVKVYQDKQKQWEIAITRIVKNEPPQIHWAYYSSEDNRISAYVTDYYGIKSVEIVSRQETKPMKGDINDIYTYEMPEGSEFNGSETVKAVNIREQSVDQVVVSTYIANLVWPTFMHDTKHTGSSKYTGPERSPRQIFKSKTGDSILSSPIIATDGTIYIGSQDKKLYAFNSKGRKKWDFETQGAISSSPAIDTNGTIYVGAQDNKVYAIQSNGKKKWEYLTGGPVYSSPVIGRDGTIYVGSTDKKVHAIKPDGKMKWEYPTGNQIYSSPAIGPEGTIYVGSFDNKVYAIIDDGDKGNKKWDFLTQGAINSSPAIAPDGTIYVGSLDNNIYAIQPNGQMRWKYRTTGPVYSSPAIDSDGTIYVGSYDYKVHAIKPDGNKKWEYLTAGPVYSSPAIDADGRIYVGSNDTYIYAIKDEEDKGREVWKYKTNNDVRSSPAIGKNGTIYVASKDSALYALQ